MSFEGIPTKQLEIVNSRNKNHFINLLPNRSNWNRSSGFASFKTGTEKASGITIFELGFKSESQLSNSLGFCSNCFSLRCMKNSKEGTNINIFHEAKAFEQNKPK
jgi:hypothetical protein